MSFPEYIEIKFLEWQKSLGKRKNIEDFAAYIGVSQATLSQWMNGKRTPGGENIRLLAEIFGNEVYDIFNLPRPNPYLQTAINNWEFMSEEKQEKIARMIAEEAAKYEAKKSTEGVRKTSKQGKTGRD